MNSCAIQLNCPKRKDAKPPLSFVNGEMAVTLPPQPRLQAVGLAYLSVKLGVFWKESII